MNSTTIADTDILSIAIACHEANREYCQSIGDTSQVPWAEAPDWQKQSALGGIAKAIDGATPEQLHVSWTDQKIADGWVYGEVKDAEAKTHPCITPYGNLPEEQRKKDDIFLATVRKGVKALMATPIPPSTQTEPGFDGDGQSNPPAAVAAGMDEDEPDTLNELVRKLYGAKRCESDAKADRIALELAIVKLVPIDDESGSRTVDAGDGLKVTVKCGLNYRADVDGIRGMTSVPEARMPVKSIPSDYKFDEKAYEALRKSNPDMANRIAEFVTVTPAKPSVTLKVG